MKPEHEKTVRGIVRAVQPSMEHWDIVSVGDWEIRMPPHVETMQEMIDAGHVDGYQHYRPGDDVFITIGEIHLRRPA